MEMILAFALGFVGNVQPIARSGLPVDLDFSRLKP
jgi:hypothetical protein